MSWYNTEGQLYDFVLFSKVRYIRNIAKQSFYPTLDAKRGADAMARLDSILSKNGFRCERPLPGVTLQMLSLAEKQFIERELVYSDKPRALYLNEPCNLSVALGGENLISISSVVSGAGIGEALNMAMGAEELIDREIPFAYKEGVGYLSPDPSECGSGVIFSSALYLPSLCREERYGELSLSLSRAGMTLYPMFSREDASDVYILSYSPDHLACEESAARYFADTVTFIVDDEKARLGIILKNCDKTIFEEARRALGLLLYCESLSEREMLRLISRIRLAHCSSPTSSAALPDILTLNYLFAEGLSASIALSAKEKCASYEELERARASFVSDYIEHKNEVKNVK